ncbi:MAG: Lrp/AsnC family transcriptional regulator [Pseudomonadota bacterium]
MKFDRIDIKILSELQKDAAQSVAAIGEKAGLSQNACWRRLKRFEDEGVLDKKVALLNERALGLGVTVYVTIRTNQHTQDWLQAFAKGVQSIPEIIEFCRLSGEADYLLKVVVRDIQDYDRVYKKLIAVAPLSDVSSSFVMERIKFTTELPLPAPGA